MKSSHFYFFVALVLSGSTLFGMDNPPALLVIPPAAPYGVGAPYNSPQAGDRSQNLDARLKEVEAAMAEKRRLAQEQRAAGIDQGNAPGKRLYFGNSLSGE